MLAMKLQRHLSLPVYLQLPDYDQILKRVSIFWLDWRDEQFHRIHSRVSIKNRVDKKNLYFDHSTAEKLTTNWTLTH